MSLEVLLGALLLSVVLVHSNEHPFMVVKSLAANQSFRQFVEESFYDEDEEEHFGDEREMLSPLRRNDVVDERIELNIPDVTKSPLLPTLCNPPSREHSSDQISSSLKLLKTGTTIAGCVTENGTCVVLAADTRATSGSIVVDKRCEKVHQIAANVWCCGAGTSGDIDALVRRVRYSFLLRGVLDDSIGNVQIRNDFDLGYSEGGQVFPPTRVSAVCQFIVDELYESKGAIGANLVLGGFEISTGKAVLAAIHPHGSIDYVPYTALGSGGLAAMSVLELGYKKDLSLQQAIDLVTKAIKSGINNDLGSGSQIDLCIINKTGVKYRPAVVREETLPVTKNDIDTEQNLYKRHSMEAEEQRGGVSGFGSLPYTINSRRKILSSEDSIQEEKREYLAGLLQL